MKREPVTIGDKTYVYESRFGGWFDRDTGKLAKHISGALVRTLDETSPPIPDRLSEIKEKISQPNPVYMAGDNYTYDPVKGWVSQSTGFPASVSIREQLDKNLKGSQDSQIEKPLTLQTPKMGIFSDALNERSFVKNKNPVPANDIQKFDKTNVVDFPQNEKVKKKDDSPIKETIVSIAKHLSVIDSYLKQKYANSKLNTGVFSDALNDNDAVFEDPKKLLEAEEDKRSSMLPMIITGVLGLIATAYDPIRDMIKDHMELFKGMATTFIGTIETLSEGMGTFLNKTGVGDPVTDKNIKVDSERFEKEIQEGGLGDGYNKDAAKAPSASTPAPGPTPQPTVPSPFPNKGPKAVTSTPSKPTASLPSQNSAFSKMQEVTKTKPATSVDKPSITSGSGMAKPVDNLILGSGFGRRNAPKTKNGRGSSNHGGQDIRVPVNTPVKAVMDGVVTRSEYSSSYGNVVYLAHGNGTETRYAHLNKLQCKKGDMVSKGQQIGLSGNTGNSGGPHLHFEVRKNGKAVDPKPFLQGAQTINADLKSAKNETSAGGSVTPSSQQSDATEEKKEKISVSGTIKTLWDKLADIVAFDTEYKPFVKSGKNDSLVIDRAAMEQHKAKVDSKSTNLLLNVMNVKDQPNMNKEGGSVKAPIVTNDDKIIMRYLEHFDLVD